MHSALNRLQTIFGFFTTCAFTLAGIIAFLSVLPFPAPPGSPSSSIVPRNVQVVKGRPHYYSSKREEYAIIRFDLDADLSSLFTWNTKQLFVYVTVNYPSEVAGSSNGVNAETELSEAVIWDMIIPATSTPYSWQNLKQLYFPDTKTKSKQTPRTLKDRKTASASKSDTKALTKPGVLSLKNQKPKYQVTDPSGIISERTNATLQLSWNVQPWVGALVWDKGFLGNRIGRWEKRKVGRSEPFKFPSLKGAKTDVVKDPEGPRTPNAGAATPVIEL